MPDPNILKNVPLFIGGLRIADMLNEVSLKQEFATLPTTNGASGGAKESVVSLGEGSLTVGGFWRKPSDGRDPDAYLWSLHGVSGVPVSVTQGGVAYLVGAASTTHGWGAGIGELSKLDLNLTGQTPLALGRLLEDHTGGTDHNSAPVELGAVADGRRLYLAVHLFGLTGTAPTLDLVIQSDGDGAFASPVSRFTVPQFAEAGYYLASLAGPITDTHFRVSCNVGGTDPATEYAVLLGIA